MNLFKLIGRANWKSFHNIEKRPALASQRVFEILIELFQVLLIRQKDSSTLVNLRIIERLLYQPCRHHGGVHSNSYISQAH